MPTHVAELDVRTRPVATVAATDVAWIALVRSICAATSDAVVGGAGLVYAHGQVLVTHEARASGAAAPAGSIAAGASNRGSSRASHRCTAGARLGCTSDARPHSAAATGASRTCRGHPGGSAWAGAATRSVARGIRVTDVWGHLPATSCEHAHESAGESDDGVQSTIIPPEAPLSSALHRCERALGWAPTASAVASAAPPRRTPCAGAVLFHSMLPNECPCDDAPEAIGRGSSPRRCCPLGRYVVRVIPGVAPAALVSRSGTASVEVDVVP